jgi:rod shape-determining protein MreC
LAIGAVASVSDGEIRVTPFVERSRLEYVRVVDYGLTGILKEPMRGGALSDSAAVAAQPEPKPPAADGAGQP